MTIHKEGYPDLTAFDPNDKHYDPKSDPDKPRRINVAVKYKRKLKRTISLSELKKQKSLAHMKLLQRGNRLSIMPVTKKERDYILCLEWATLSHLELLSTRKHVVKFLTRSP